MRPEELDKRKFIDQILDRDFTYHAPRNKKEIEAYELIRENTREYITNILWGLPKNSKETDMFLEKINEAVMWANASLARGLYDFKDL